MRHLDRLMLLESPDHPVIKRPWDYDVLALRCSWDGGNDGLRLEVWVSHYNGHSVDLTFTGVFDLMLDGFRPLVGLRILDATQLGTETPICVVHFNWKRDGGEPYFWAASVECRRR